jgi:polar amino acid transport system substrate-binding protein
MSRTTLRIASLFSVLALALSACGASGSSSGSPTSEANGLGKAGVLRIGTAVVYPPLISYKEGTTEIQGIDYDIIQAVGEKLGVKVEISNSEFATLVPGVAMGRWDATMTMFITEERQKTIDQISYMKGRGGMLIRKGDGPSSFEELCGKPVTYVKGSLWTADVQKLATTCQNNGQEPPKPVETASAADSKQMLLAGRAEALITDLPIAIYVAKTTGDGSQIDVVTKPYGSEMLYGIGIKKGNAALAESLQGALREVISDGTYQKILEKYQVADLAVDEPVVNPAPRQL